MARGRFARAMEQAQLQDERRLPSFRRLERPGPYGTHPERSRGMYPKAPPMSDGPPFVGEWREDIAGNDVILPGDGTPRVLVSLRSQWPFVGWAVDTSRTPGGATVTTYPQVMMRGGQARIVTNWLNVVTPTITWTGPQSPPWIAFVGLIPGARVEIVGQLTPTEATAKVRAVIWGYYAPGFGL